MSGECESGLWQTLVLLLPARESAGYRRYGCLILILALSVIWQTFRTPVADPYHPMSARSRAKRLAGPRSALGSAIGCGILLGVFEGELFRRRSFRCNAALMD